MDNMTEMLRLEVKDSQGASVGGREWTPAQRHRAARKSAFLKALHDLGSLGQACQASGVSDVTILRWRRSYPAFDKAVSDFLLNVREQRVVDSLYQLTQKATEDPKFASAGGRAGEFLLKSWNPAQFGERIQVDTRHELNVQVQVVTGLQDRRRIAIAELERVNVPAVDADFSFAE